ncbi:MAG TPA: hypothetical protein DCE48_09325 [Lachnospiraceae bacterium]|uniref:hypothetical protein n=1 Tax=Anaerosporobacter sp. TaxID=1872529 RepID=UPI000ED29950|nr:hypothetical protein [Anaerosporobacter sp.]HAB60889.1 hypothetical protein [Lachnospiraceae bacterium]
MEHSFSVKIAEKLGITPAILLNNIYFWTRYNEANDRNYHDGMYWTFNSSKSWKELFPYLTDRQISYALKKLKDEGYIITGNYNEMKYDRTLWYAITELGKSIIQNCQMDITKLSNGNDNNVESKEQFCENEMTIMSNRSDNFVEPIPDINTDINTDINKKKNTKEKSKEFVVYDPDEKLNQAIHEFIAFRESIKAKITDHGIDLMLKKLDKLANNNDDKIEILNNSIIGGWKGIFELNKQGQKNNGRQTMQDFAETGKEWLNEREGVLNSNFGN